MYREFPATILYRIPPARTVTLPTMTREAPFTVLYVDDEPDLLALGKVFLESCGEFSVNTCQSGEEALEFLQTRTCDAIVSDYLMPGMDGLRLLGTVRDQYGNIPFILFTGRGREAVVIEAINLGVDFYLQKGGDARAQFAELTHKIRMAVARRQAEAALKEREAQLISLSDNLPSGVTYQMLMSPEGNGSFMYVSAGVEKLHEVKAADVIKDPSLLYRQILPEYLTILKEGERQAHASLTPFSAEVRFRAPSGTERWVLIRSAPRPLADGWSVWDGIELDITPTKRTEEELRAAYQQLAASQAMLKEQVAELNRSQELIAESEEKYRTLVEHTDDIVFIAQDGKVIFGNTALAELSGYTLDEIVGQPFTLFIAPEDRGMVLGRHLSRQDGDTPPEAYEFSLLHKDQETRIRVNIRVGPGTIQGRPATIGTLHNVTKERQQEDELARSEELHRKMVAASPDIIVRSDLDGKIVFINNKGLQLAKKSDISAIIGSSMFAFFAPESLPEAIENTKLMFSGPLGPREYTFIDGDGSRLLLEVNGDILRTPAGIPYGMVYVCRDISERKRAEETLRKSEEEFRNIVSTMQDVFYRLNREGIITMISPYGARIVGYDSPEDICGKLAACDFYADPKERDTFFSHILKEKNVTGYPLTLKDRYGNLHYAMASSHLIYDKDGNVDGIEGILHDITDLRRVEQALRQANRQITLMAGITRHDIRNQLHALTGYLALSETATRDPHRAAELIAKEQKIVQAIGEQINFMTCFDDRGGKPPIWQDPAPLLEKTRAELPFLQVSLEIPVPGTEIFSDPLLEKVFYNILDDALRYGGGGMTAIRAYYRYGDPGLTLVIEDNGIGIPYSEKVRIFERGFGRNTGLGLFLVQEILAITGITIRETGTPGSGARFEIAVPEGTWRKGAQDPK